MKSKSDSAVVSGESEITIGSMDRLRSLIRIVMRVNPSINSIKSFPFHPSLELINLMIITNCFRNKFVQCFELTFLVITR